MQQEIRFVLAHGSEGDHAAIIRIDTPALSRDIAAPDETDVAAVAGRGAEAADHRLALDVSMRKVAKPDAIKDVLAGRQVFQQHFCGEVALRECRDRRQGPRVAKRFGGGDLDHHLRRTVGARPHHAAIGADVAGLHAMGDLRTVGGAAEIRHRDHAGAGRCGSGEESSAGNIAGKSGRHACLVLAPSFRGDAKHRARNLEIPRRAIAHLRSGAGAPSRNDGFVPTRYRKTL